MTYVVDALAAGSSGSSGSSGSGGVGSDLMILCLLRGSGILWLICCDHLRCPLLVKVDRLLGGMHGIFPFLTHLIAADRKSGLHVEGHRGSLEIFPGFWYVGRASMHLSDKNISPRQVLEEIATSDVMEREKKLTIEKSIFDQTTLLSSRVLKASRLQPCFSTPSLIFGFKSANRTLSDFWRHYVHSWTDDDRGTTFSETGNLATGPVQTYQNLVSFPDKRDSMPVASLQARVEAVL